MYFGGQGVLRDHALAALWFRKAAEQGYAQAQTNLGSVYHDGLGVPRDHAEALLWWCKAARQGHAKAQQNLAVLMPHEKAEPLYMRMNTPFGQRHPHVSHIPGQAEYNAGNFAAVLKVIRPLAERGDAISQHSMGVLYFNGQGVARDRAVVA